VDGTKIVEGARISIAAIKDWGGVPMVMSML
jgi:hypothetical protein